MRMWWQWSVLVCLLLLIGVGTVIPVQAQEQERCFDVTGLCVSGPFLAYWERNGGLPVFGYPITLPRVEEIEGRPLSVQWFQRDRLELHADGQVTTGLLGARLLELRDTPWYILPGVEQAPDGCIFFVEFGHSLCEPFLSYWNTNGSVERFGYPITEPHEEMIEGRSLMVQYFERRRMEWHTDLPGQPVLLGLLGNEVLLARPLAPCVGKVVAGLEAHLTPNTYARTRLGCPHEVYERIEAAEQFFERGVMVYIQHPSEETRTIYVLTTMPPPVRYQVFPDTWTSAESHGGDEPPPPGLFAPMRGFGKVWREQPEVRAALGWATAPERPDEVTYQSFDNGAVLWFHTTDFVYAFFSDDTNDPTEVAAQERVLP